MVKDVQGLFNNHKPYSLYHNILWDDLFLVRDTEFLVTWSGLAKGTLKLETALLFAVQLSSVGGKAGITVNKAKYIKTVTFSLENIPPAFFASERVKCVTSGFISS